MTEPQAPEPVGPPGDDDDYHLFVEEEGVVVSAEDLFELPTAARSLPGMDPVESAAAMVEFTEAEAEPEAKPAEGYDWRTRIVLGVLSLITVAGIGVTIRKHSSHSEEIAESPPAVEVTPPSIPEVAVTRPPEIHVTREPEVIVTREPEVPVTREPEVVVARPPELAVSLPPEIPHTRPPEAREPAPAPAMPAIQRTGRERIDAIEVALASKRRGFARIELGRLLLDIDALPDTEREEIRAQAELRLALLLQDAADEARGQPR